MEKATDISTATASQFIKVTPELLRTVANKLEMLGNITLPGHTITYTFSPHVTLCYEVQKSVEKFAKQFVKELESEIMYENIEHQQQ